MNPWFYVLMTATCIVALSILVVTIRVEIKTSAAWVWRRLVDRPIRPTATAAEEV